MSSASATTRVPVGWKSCQLGDICDIQLGKMLSPRSKTGRNAFAYLRNANVQWNRFELDDVATMDFDERERRKFELKPGDLLVCEGGEPGRAAVWEGEITPCYYQKALHRLRPIAGDVDPRFVMFRLLYGSLTDEFADSHAKTTIAHLPAVRLASLPLALPPIEVQRAIVQSLRDQFAIAERARAAAESKLKATKSLPTGILEERFERNATRNFETYPLRRVLTLRREIVHPRNRPSGTAPFVGLEHIESSTGNRLGSLEVDKSKLTGRKPVFKTGDIVYGYLRPYLNKVWLAEFDGLCSVDQYVYFVDPSTADAEYVAWFLRSPLFLRRAPISQAPGQLPRIRTEEIASVQIELPPISAQRRFVRDLTTSLVAADSARRAAEAELVAVEALSGALLRRAFRGEL